MKAIRFSLVQYGNIYYFDVFSKLRMNTQIQ